MDDVWYKKSKDVYDARCKIQQHYKGETFQMQIDSHHRFVKDWDTKSIEMLHSCDAGEFSVLTTYVSGPYLETDEDNLATESYERKI